MRKKINGATRAWVAWTLTSLLLVSQSKADGGATGAPSTAPGSPPAVLELQGGVAVKASPAASIGLDVETRPFIYRVVGLRLGMSWVAQSSWNGENLSQLGTRLQATAGWSRLEIAVGPILLQHTDAYDAGRLNMASTVDVALTAHWRVRAEHWSDAQSTFSNKGRNVFLINYRF